ncbi:MAG: ATP-binding protein, partial [Leptolyngbyaceae bacterium]|nr:ATP-binding protein [Leptolyngbyaceae bacterium]
LMNRQTTPQTTDQEYLNIISHSADHLLDLINDVLDLSKLDAERTILNPSNFDIESLLQEIYNMFCLRAQSKGLILNLVPDGSLPQCIHADQKKLRQILINLLGNAMKFTATGSITIRAKAEAETENPQTDSTHRLHLEIEDTGIGIPAQQLTAIFDAFTQLQPNLEGTGLGLAISQRFTTLMGGTLTAQSVMGEGTKFSLSLPVKEVFAVDIPETAESRRVVGVAANQPTYRILVVDDRWDNRQFLLKLLSPLGFDVREAENGQWAVALWQEWQPHLIWMDMRMPVMDGYEATQYIKAHLAGQATVIIAFTASVFEDEREIVLAKGCDDFVRKPVSANVIFEKLTQHLGIEFIYEERPTTGESVPSALLPLHPSDFAVMPPEWLTQFRQAATIANPGPLHALIKEIPGEQAPFAQRLSQMVDCFEFELISQCIPALETDDRF